jgi:short-subunit dehydrogenase involved in D-alanine esterification of teichoic acids
MDSSDRRDCEVHIRAESRQELIQAEFKSLVDKVAVVTGAGRGIGRAISGRFAREGADLFLCATRLETLKETANPNSNDKDRFVLVYAVEWSYDWEA